MNGALTDDSVIHKRPYLQKHTFTALTNVGSTYSITLRAYNEIGFIESETLTVVLAAVPDTPSTAPYQDYSQTSSSQIKVLYDALALAENGGSQVLGYDLWRDDGLSGNYFRVYSSDQVLSTIFYD